MTAKKTQSTSPAEEEVKKETAGTDDQQKKEFPRFTVEIDGESMELEDRYRQDKIPAALAMIGKRGITDQQRGEYLFVAADQILGEDQVFELVAAGADVEELGSVINEWRKARGLGEGSSSSAR